MDAHVYIDVCTYTDVHMYTDVYVYTNLYMYMGWYVYMDAGVRWDDMRGGGGREAGVRWDKVRGGGGREEEGGEGDAFKTRSHTSESGGKKKHSALKYAISRDVFFKAVH